MEINKNKSGVLYWSDWIDGKRVKRENKKWKTKKEVKAHYDEFVSEYNNGIIKDNNLTFKQLCNQYIIFCETGKNKPSTISKKKDMIKNHLDPFFSSVKVRRIKLKDIDGFQNYMLNKTFINKKDKTEKKYSNEMLEKVQCLLRDLLSFATKRDYLNKNPFDLTFIKYHRNLEMNQAKEEIQIITKEDFDALISVVSSLTEIALYQLLYWCGTRPGEALGLCINDYSINTRILSITKNWDDKNQILVTTKTGEHRSLYVPEVAHNALIALLDSYPKEYTTADTPLFGYTKRLAKTTLRNHLKAHCRKAGIEVITFMTFRHTNVSMLASLGFTDKEISLRTGHSVEILNKNYKHIFPERLNTINERLDNISKNP